ncbi:3-hydroxyisobutyryl-CoA hydrolase [Microbotryomycetes sp. JL201]|nr:3-hydroxyisobutyryl-CoA hydrolase [Microbotryomycetes sp. JL201]
MVQQHLATSSGQEPASATDAVVFEAVHSLRKIRLNRPKALNALNLEMVDAIQPALEKYEQSDLANVVMLTGTGDKAFCAGGDVRMLILASAFAALVNQLNDEKTWHKSADFFAKEYVTDGFIANMKTPVISVMHGITLGGGVGLSMHAPFRIATERTLLGMPETNIGLFPDVGANFFLGRLDGHLGEYLGVTGQNLKGKAALFAGFASHYVPSERLGALEARLSELEQGASKDVVNAAIEEFVADEQELATAEPAYDLVGAKRRAIDFIFGKKTAEEMVADLKALQDGSLDMSKIVREGETTDVSQLQKWASDTLKVFEHRSPTSIKLTIKAIREGRKLDIDEVFMMDHRIATACCNPEAAPDFRTGVTHNLIQKKRDSRPAWSPSTLEEVSDGYITKTFFSNPPPFTNPPLKKLAFVHKRPAGVRAYKDYPHAIYSLPTEKDIKDVVTGEAKGSGKYALTEKEVVKQIVKRWNGKVGAQVKVKEVLARRCRVENGETLKWIN